MEETYLTKAIVLKREAHREFDARVLVYSQTRGKLDLVARGMLKPGSKLAAHLEPITLVNLLVILGKKRNYAGSAIGLDAYQTIKNDFNRSYYTGLALNLFNRLVHLEHEDSQLFALLFSFLTAMAKESAEAQMLYLCFCLRLISVLGYQPDLYHCALCHQELVYGANYFNSATGQIIGSNCSSAGCGPISDPAIKAMRLILSGDLPFLEGVEVKDEVWAELELIIPKIVEYSVF